VGLEGSSGDSEREAVFFFFGFGALRFCDVLAGALQRLSGGQVQEQAVRAVPCRVSIRHANLPPVCGGPVRPRGVPVYARQRRAERSVLPGFLLASSFLGLFVVVPMERRRGSAWVVGVVFLNRRNLWLVQAFCEKGAKCGKAHNWECPEVRSGSFFLYIFWEGSSKGSSLRRDNFLPDRREGQLLERNVMPVPTQAAPGGTDQAETARFRRLHELR